MLRVSKGKNRFPKGDWDKGFKTSGLKLEKKSFKITRKPLEFGMNSGSPIATKQSSAIISAFLQTSKLSATGDTVHEGNLVRGGGVYLCTEFSFYSTLNQ